MAPRRELSVEERVKVMTLYEERMSMRDIAKHLKISPSTVSRTIKRYQETGGYANKSSRGGVTKLNSKDVKYLCLLSVRNRRKTSTELAHEILNTTGKTVSSRLVRYKLCSNGLRGRVAARKPLLRGYNVKRRFNWCKEKRQWIYADWIHALFSDESKFELFGNNRRQYVRRRVNERFLPECLVPTVKHGGGSLQVWGCISANGVGDLVRVNGIMDADKYKQILQHHAIPCGTKLIGRGFLMQQDNDPKHTARRIKDYLNSKYMMELLN